MKSGNIYNSTLKRKTPLRGNGFFKKKELVHAPKKAPKTKRALRKMSPDRAVEMHEYGKVRRAFLLENTSCRICYVRGIIPPNEATEVHHVRGRANSLLCDVRGFISSCRPCREFPHENPSLARSLGVLASSRLWGEPFDRSPMI